MHALANCPHACLDSQGPCMYRDRDLNNESIPWQCRKVKRGISVMAHAFENGACMQISIMMLRSMLSSVCSCLIVRTLVICATT